MLDEKSIWEGKHIVEIVESLGTDEKLMVNSFAIGVLRMQELAGEGPACCPGA